MTDPPHGCWDEAHFGKFASWYLNRTFFFDVHPPLGKLMIAGMGYFTGYNGSFHFSDPGDEFGDHQVMGMRIGCTLIGVLIVPIAFLTIWELTESISASAISSTMLIFDNGFAVLNRYILLDPLLICFMSASVLANIKFRSIPESRSFTKEWWFYLTLTGVLLMAMISVKFVGLFTILFIGVNTAYDLWRILGDTTAAWSTFLKHLLARCLCLILTPIILYICFFFIHLQILSKSGGGDAHYHPRFQATLEGNQYVDLEINKYVEYGSIITLKGSNNFPCAYLHSHEQRYPKGLTNGAPQQMITNYMHRDDNNHFLVKRWKGDENYSDERDNNIVRHGDKIVLEHVNTRRNLHSHNHKALVAENHYQVTGYGEDGNGDDNDVWRIEIQNGKQGQEIEAMNSVLKIRHYFLKCLLSCTAMPFPNEWGFGQQEVACSPWQRQTSEGNGMRKSTWFVEENNVTAMISENPRISLQSMKMGFWEKFFESHKMMFWLNSKIGTGGDPGKWLDMGGQIPIKWPFNLVNQVFSPKEPRTYLLGNPRIWAINLLVLVIFPMLALTRIIQSRESVVHKKEQDEDKHFSASLQLFCLWMVNYFPFFMMFRVLYIHHYYPALYFSSLLTGVVMDWSIKSFSGLLPQQISPMFRLTFFVSFFVLLLNSFIEFSPLVYGMHGDMAKFSNSSYHHLYWLDWWDF